MHFVGAVGQTQGAHVRPGIGQESVLADAHRPVGLNRAIDHAQGHFGGDDLDHGDFLTGLFIAHLVHHLGGLQRHQPGLVDLDARSRDLLADGVEFGKLAAEAFPRLDAITHGFQRAFGDPDGAHAVMNPSRAEPALGDLETTAFAQDQIFGRHAHVVEADLGMAFRRVVIAKNMQRAFDRHARRVERHEDHRLLLVTLGRRIALAHDDGDLAVRGHRPGGPPLAAVDDVVIAVAPDLGRDIGGVRGGHIRLGHGETGLDLPGQKRLQPTILLGIATVAGQHFHIAGIRRTAIEHHGGDRRAAHDLAEMRIVEVRQVGAVFGVRQKQVP